MLYMSKQNEIEKLSNTLCLVRDRAKTDYRQNAYYLSLYPELLHYDGITDDNGEHPR